MKSFEDPMEHGSDLQKRQTGIVAVSGRRELGTAL
jgi:hypothetical protein